MIKNHKFIILLALLSLIVIVSPVSTPAISSQSPITPKTSSSPEIASFPSATATPIALNTVKPMPAIPQPTKPALRVNVNDVDAQTAEIIPSRLVIPKLGVNAPVRSMGLEASGRMAVPNNFTEVGWFSLGAKPGAVGQAVMGAHVDNGGSKPGVFKNLKKLAVGDVIYVSDRSGKTLRYKVVKTKVYDRNESDTSEVFGAVDKSHLNLITCFGTWLPQYSTYSGRLVVTAELG